MPDIRRKLSLFFNEISDNFFNKKMKIYLRSSFLNIITLSSTQTRTDGAC